jgi:hypothetical protein
MLITKELIKEEIENLNEDELKKVYRLINKFNKPKL